MKITRWLTATLLTASGCGATFEQLQRRAALDLECRPEAISARYLDAETSVATGCGKQAIYVETCSSNNHTGCAWMLNSAVKPIGVQTE